MTDSFERAAQDARELAARIEDLREKDALALAQANLEREFGDLREAVLGHADRLQSLVDSTPQKCIDAVMKALVDSDLADRLVTARQMRETA